jgi:hypothetical protein
MRGTKIGMLAIAIVAMLLAGHCAAISPAQITVKFGSERNDDAYRHGVIRFPREFVLDSLGCIEGARRFTFYSDARLADQLGFGGDEQVVWYVFLYVDAPKSTALVDVANGIERLRTALINNATGNCKVVIEVLPCFWHYANETVVKLPSEARDADRQHQWVAPIVRYLSKPSDRKSTSPDCCKPQAYTLKPSGQISDESSQVSDEMLVRQLSQTHSHDRSENILLCVDDPERTAFEQLRQALDRFTVAATNHAREDCQIVIEVFPRADAPRTRSEEDPAAKYRRMRQFPDSER